MRFQYEIPVDEYMEGQLLYFRLTHKRQIARGVGWIAAGACLIVLGGNTAGPELQMLVLTGIGAWWAYVGAARAIPAWHRYFLRRAYPRSAVVGRSYSAEVNQDGFEVTSTHISWKIAWAGVEIRGEGINVFVFCAGNTLFIFGKKYLDTGQQQELRQFSAPRPN